MGISQHTHGTDNARCLIALCALTGNVGRPGTGLHPLRGQNNVQGASDAGLIPMFYPDYQPVATRRCGASSRRRGERRARSAAGPDGRGDHGGGAGGADQGMYMMGENPFLSDPNINKVRKALATLEFLAVQDIFLTETAEFADVVLPATLVPGEDRDVHEHRPARADRPPGAGAARRGTPRLGDRACDLGGALGYPMAIVAEEVFAEFAALTESYRGLTYERLGATGKLWPCPDPEHTDGRAVLFGDRFPTPRGRGKLVPCELPRRRSCRTRVSVGAEHRAAAGALAHGDDDAARVGAGAASPAPARSWRCTRTTWRDAGHGGRRDGDGALAAGDDRAAGAAPARRCRRAACSSRSTSARRRRTC